jgi:hypothetical protein
MTDIIGDIHGHAEKLESLLIKLGYEKKNGCYRHSERKVLFVGDYIDRGPKIRETLQIVRAMVENQQAVALMGNHEYNAICFHFQETEGGHLRKHLIKNITQHYETLKQFQNRQEEYEDYIDWFKTLPVFYENESFRAVHACWDNEHIELLKEKLGGNVLNDEMIYESVKHGTIFNNAILDTLKGKELALPENFEFKDKDGNIRKHIRIKWWLNPENSTFKELSVEPIENLPKEKAVFKNPEEVRFYSENEKPVFFGHYWLKGNPIQFSQNVCCVDFSVAKGGYLVAYRFDGETQLTADKLVYV